MCVCLLRDVPMCSPGWPDSWSPQVAGTGKGLSSLAQTGTETGTLPGLLPRGSAALAPRAALL